MKNFIHGLVFALARWAGIAIFEGTAPLIASHEFCRQGKPASVVSRPSEDVMLAAHEFCAHVMHQKEPPEWKRRQVLRALTNRFPKSRIRDLSLAIEVAVQECSEY